MNRLLMGLSLIAIGILVGLYVGVWLMFIGGIMDLVEFAETGFETYQTLGWGVIKLFFAGASGWLSAIVFIIPGWLILDD